MTISQQHKIAADLYLAGRTKKAALLEAGYALTVAKKPQDIFGRDDVQEYINAARGELAKRTLITKEKLSLFLWEIINANIGDFIESDGSIDFDALGRGERNALLGAKIRKSHSGKKHGRTKVDIEVKMESKLAAAKLLADMHGFTDNSIKLTAEKDLISAMNRGFGAVKDGN